MFWFQLAIVAFVLFVIAAVAAGRGGSMGAAYPDRPDLWLPEDRWVHQDDVDRIRFSVGLRGYRMSEVDQVLDRLAGELAARDARIRELSPNGSVEREPSPPQAPDIRPAERES